MHKMLLLCMLNHIYSHLTVFNTVQTTHSVFTYQVNIFRSHGIMHKKL